MLALVERFHTPIGNNGFGFLQLRGSVGKARYVGGFQRSWDLSCHGSRAGLVRRAVLVVVVVRLCEGYSCFKAFTVVVQKCRFEVILKMTSDGDEGGKRNACELEPARMADPAPRNLSPPTGVSFVLKTPRPFLLLVFYSTPHHFNSPRPMRNWL